MVVYKNSQNTHRKSTTSLTIVIKVGTSSICDETTHYPLLGNLSRIVETIVELKKRDHRVVLVTSAAVGTGLRRLNLQDKPTQPSLVQAIAAVGQGRLMSLYDDLFGRFNQTVAQILLTKTDLAQRSQYLNAVHCMEALLEMDVVPIVNENDTISYSEIKFGDNDTLSAITAGMVKADYLFLLTDVDCLYTDNPRTNPEAQPILVCQDMQRLKQSVKVTSPGSSLGTGGMVTKLMAAELATSAGVTTIITKASTPEHVLSILAEEKNENNENMPLHTRFSAHRPMMDRMWWILHGLHTAGTLVVDASLAHTILHNQWSPPSISSTTSSSSSSSSSSSAASSVSSLSMPSASLLPSEDEEDEELEDEAMAKSKSSTGLYAHSVHRVEGHFVEHQAVRLVMIQDDQPVTIAKGLVNYSSSEIGRFLQEKAKVNEYPCIIDKDNMAISI